MSLSRNQVLSMLRRRYDYHSARAVLAEAVAALGLDGDTFDAAALEALAGRIPEAAAHLTANAGAPDAAAEKAAAAKAAAAKAAAEKAAAEKAAAEKAAAERAAAEQAAAEQAAAEQAADGDDAGDDGDDAGDDGDDAGDDGDDAGEDGAKKTTRRRRSRAKKS